MAQRDNMPESDAFPTTRWPVNQPIEDMHVIPLPPDVPAGSYRIALGMYLYQTGERLPVRGPNGDPIPDAAIVLDQTVHVSD